MLFVVLLAAIVLVIGGEQDNHTPPHKSEELSEAFAGKRWLWVVAGLSHDQLSDLDDETYRSRVLTFLDEEMLSQ